MVHTDLITNIIKENLEPIKIILFGSYSKGKEKSDSDLDIAIIQKETPKLGQKAKVYLALNNQDYDWRIEPDIHIFSQKDFDLRLKNEDLFVSEVAKGKVLYEEK